MSLETNILTNTLFAMLKILNVKYLNIVIGYFIKKKKKQKICVL